VFAMDLQVGLDHPMMTVMTLALKKKSMRPRAPILLLIQVTLSPANRLINESDSPGKSNAPGTRVKIQEFTVGQSRDRHSFALHRSGLLCHRNKDKSPDVGYKLFPPLPTAFANQMKPNGEIKQGQFEENFGPVVGVTKLPRVAVR